MSKTCIYRAMVTLVAALALTACGPGDDNNKGNNTNGGNNNTQNNNTQNNNTQNNNNNTQNNNTQNNNNNTTDPCAGVTECDTAGTTCDGDTLVVCEADANGCLVETETDCAANGESCDAPNGMCVVGCMDEPDCAGATDGTSLCNGELLVMCAAGADGCLDATTQDCAIGGGTCNADSMTCEGCSDDTECEGLAENDEFCNAAGDAITTCVDTNADGCLEAMDTACNMDESCNDSGAMPVCEMSMAMCADSIQTLSCADAGMMISGDTANGTSVIDSYACGIGGHPGNEVIYIFEDTSLSDVTVSVDFDSSGGVDMDLFALEGAGLACTDPNISCEDDSAFDNPEVVEFASGPGKTVYVALDAWDDAAATTTYTLSITCESPVCGDGVLGAGEECDDMNTDDGDGCSATCEVEQGYGCEGEPSTCQQVVCGDGIVYGGEECDDMNTADNDGCSANCTIEQGYSCDTTVEPTVCEPEVCGDGLLVGAEECDDMNTDDGDGCSANCTIEADYVCDTSVEPTVCAQEICGDGLIVGDEECDDMNTDDADGCAADCTVEDGYNCDDSEPSVCALYPSIGVFAAGEAIPDSNGGPIPGGQSFSYTIEFTETVLLSGSATAMTGDIDVTITNEDGNTVLAEGTSGSETWSDAFLAAGVYTIELTAFGSTDIPSYTLSLSTTAMDDAGSFGAGDAITDRTGGPLTAGDSDTFTITFTQDVLVGGSLTSPDGDMDLIVFSDSGNVLTASADDGDEPAIDLALQAGTYVFQLNAYEDFFSPVDVPSYTLSLTTTALAVTDIGSFGAGDAIADTTGGPLPERDFDHYTITFTEDVLLSGSLGGNTTGETSLFIYDSNEAPLLSATSGADETFTDVEVAAGTYIVQIRTQSTALMGGDVDAYTLSLSSTTP